METSKIANRKLYLLIFVFVFSFCKSSNIKNNIISGYPAINSYLDENFISFSHTISYWDYGFSIMRSIGIPDNKYESEYQRVYLSKHNFSIVDSIFNSSINLKSLVPFEEHENNFRIIRIYIKIDNHKVFYNFKNKEDSLLFLKLILFELKSSKLDEINLLRLEKMINYYIEQVSDM